MAALQQAFQKVLRRRGLLPFHFIFSLVLFTPLQCRVEYVATDEAVGAWGHLRLSSLMATLVASDAAMLAGCAYLAVASLPSVLLLFGFEYAILCVAALTTTAKYLLHLVDTRIEGVWQGKGLWNKGIELLGEAARFALFLAFFAIVFTYYGMPLHIMREVWVSLSNLRRCWAQFRRYRRLMAGLNERFPDATEAEMRGEGGDYSECIICRDELGPGCKRLPCGHIFHLDCLRLWLHEKHDCPTCRADIPVDGPASHRHRAAPAAAPAAAAPAAQQPAAAAPAPAEAAPAPVGPAAQEAAAREAAARFAAARAPAPPAPAATAASTRHADPPPPGLGAHHFPGSATSGAPGGPGYPGSPFGGFPGPGGGGHPGSPYGGFPGQDPWGDAGAFAGLGSPMAFGGLGGFSGMGAFGGGGGGFGGMGPAPTLVRVVKADGVLLRAAPDTASAETRTAPCGAVLVACAAFGPAGAPSHYQTLEGDWVAAPQGPAATHAVEVLTPDGSAPPAGQPPLSPMGPGAAFGGSPYGASPLGPFGSPFGSPFGIPGHFAGIGSPYGSPGAYGFQPHYGGMPMASPAPATPAAPPSTPAAAAPQDATMAAMAAELEALKATIRALQQPKDGPADLAGSEGPAAGGDGSGLRQRRPAGERAASAGT